MQVAPVILVVGALIFLAHLFVAVFSRFRVPDILLLTLIGLVLGPILHLVRPEQLGAVGPVFTTVTLVLLLFESGTGLRFETVHKALRGTLVLALTSFMATLTVVGALAHFVAHMGALSALIFGAILGGTSPTVVIPLAGHLGMAKESRVIVFLESALGDVLSIILTLTLLRALQMGSLDVGKMLGTIISSFTFAVVLGFLGAAAWSVLLNKIRNLRNAIMTTLAFVFVIYGITEILGYNGAMASLAFGITLGNVDMINSSALRRLTFLEPISLNQMERTVFAEIVFILKTFFFVFVGVSIQFINSGWLLIGLLATACIFLLRIPIVKFCVPKSLPRTDAARMAIMAPKGLAAAVLASICVQAKVPSSNLILAATDGVILLSITLTSILVFLQDKTRLAKFYRFIFSDFAEPIPVEPEPQAAQLKSD